MTDNAMRELRATIAQLIQDRRPDRYTVGGNTDDDMGVRWLQEIAEEVEPLVPESAAQKALAITLVKQAEARATRSANKFFRDFARTGQIPMLWEQDGHWPLSVVTEHYENGVVKRIEERVALRAVTPDDLDACEIEERRRSAKDFASRNDACDGMHTGGTVTREAGLPLFWQWVAAQSTGQTDEV